MIKVRNARFSDFAAVAQLHARNWQQHYRGIMNDSFLDNEVEEDRRNVWHERSKSPPSNQEVFVATLENAIIGFACLYIDDDPVYGSLLDNLHVSGAMQGSGIGKRLLKTCAKRIIENSETKRMYLWVFELNESARNVYDRLAGRNVETIEEQNFDGDKAKVCRYAWDDVTVLL